MSGIDFAISLLKLEPTNANVSNNVIPSPRDITVIGVILFDCVIFLIAIFEEIPRLIRLFLSNNIIKRET